MPSTGVAVARVSALYRYPVKSMAGEPLETTRLWWHGLEGDRRYAFVQAGSTSAFPWLTAREFPGLLLYRPAFNDPSDPARSPVSVRTPSGALLPIESQELRAEVEACSGRAAYLLQLGRGAVDSMHISLVGQASLDSMSAESGVELEARRFRPNIVVESLDGLPYAEERWLDGTLIFGERQNSARVQVVRRDQRCMIVNLDPQTAIQDPEVLRTITRARQVCFGVYATVLRPGSIVVGDVVRLVKSD